MELAPPLPDRPREARRDTLGGGGVALVAPLTLEAPALDAVAEVAKAQESRPLKP